MPSKFFRNDYERRTMREHLDKLKKKSVSSGTGKIKNMKAQYSGAKKKASTSSGSQRGS